MTFLRLHCWSSVAFNLLTACWAIQLSAVVLPFLKTLLLSETLELIPISLLSLLDGLFAATAVLVTLGALLGKASWSQMLFIGTLEVIFFGVNKVLYFDVLKSNDLGGAVYVHLFGAYFGLAAARFFSPRKALQD